MDPDQAVAEEVRAVDGRTPGRRGRATREKLLKCTAELLEKSSYRDLTVIDIARCAGCSPATFYQYFTDVEAAVLVLAEEMASNGTDLTALIRDADWRGKNGNATAESIVESFLELWERHRAILKVVDLATAEGDLRFQSARTHLLNAITVGLRGVIEDFRTAGAHSKDTESMAQAATLVSMLAHVAQHQYGYEFWGIRMADMRKSLARILYAGITGKR